MALAGFVFIALAGWGKPASAAEQSGARLVLEDFSGQGGHSFPKDWKAQRNESRAKEAYVLKTEDGSSYLSATKADQRVYKRVAWDPKAVPMVTWRWRIRTAPAGAEPLAAVFVSLDTDLMFIPVSTKYTWSASKAKGTLTEGGLFGAAEIVVRSGLQPIGEWIEERVNVYEDFKRIHKHEPAAQAWGISLLGGPGVEVDFGPIVASGP
jgi:hypothetical protein